MPCVLAFYFDKFYALFSNSLKYCFFYLQCILDYMDGYFIVNSGSRELPAQTTVGIVL